ncbi:hypothetical protein, partial [Bradyrhizobium iriomotense]|uniref:hypothetical protein n=1 Tax=Bradyrhizobium iriomotense TaxID=441950 RepID=UPI0024E04D76
FCSKFVALLGQKNLEFTRCWSEPFGAAMSDSQGLRAWRHIDKSKPIAATPHAALARERRAEKTDPAKMRCSMVWRGTIPAIQL